MAYDRQLRRCESCGKRVIVNCYRCRLADIVKEYQVELFNLEASKYGVSLTTYFGDIYIFTRTIFLTVGIVAVLLIAKRIRKAVR